MTMPPEQADRPVAAHRPIPGDILAMMAALKDAKHPFAVATVVETTGSASAKVGAKAIVDHDGRVIAGWVGGGCAEGAVCHTALDCLREGEGKVIEIEHRRGDVDGRGKCVGSRRAARDLTA